MYFSTKSSETASDVPHEGSGEAKVGKDDSAVPPVEPLPTASSDAVDFLFSLGKKKDTLYFISCPFILVFSIR